MKNDGNAGRHADVPEWGLEDLTGSVLYDVFYESTTMLAGRMLAQQRLGAAQGNWYREHWARLNRYELLFDRDKVGPTDRETLIRLKRENDSKRGGRAHLAVPWHSIGRSLAVDVEGIWRDDIRPVIDAATRSDRPCTVFVGGQPGAGKTRATHLVRVSGLHDGPLLPVNGDDLRQYHPDYDRLCDEEPLNMPERTAKASAAWIRMTMEYADADGIPAIVEGTWRNAATVLGEAANAKRAGRSTHAVVLAVLPVLSRLAMLERYYRDRSAGLPSRWTPASAHENAVANLPATVRAVAASPLVDRLTVIDRDGGVLYDGTDPDMFAGRWEDGFHRPLSAAEAADVRVRLARIGSLRRVPGVGTALSDPVVLSIRRDLEALG
ncbi:zeta toxin family protein [Bifidobacterium moukalabense]|uniref:zeta toxin family protein n=1 Tax=Bifidobacterium moukalabense TaxID=1333651 RepID=UPI001FCEF2CA|nr:zeta toxin family protein [Bifidobacterium moukalabense]